MPFQGRNPRLSTALMLAGSLAAAAGSPARAAFMTYAYNGVITSADPSTGVAAGTPFSGTFTYDPAAKSPLYLSIEGMNQYSMGRTADSHFGTPDASGSTLKIGGGPVLASPGGLGVSVTEQEFPGQWGYGNANGTPAGPSTKITIDNDGVTPGTPEFGLNLSNPNRSVFGSLALPAKLNLADFPLATMTVDDPSDHHRIIETGTIEGLQLTTVPEPAGAALFGAIAAALAARSLRRQHSAA